MSDLRNSSKYYHVVLQRIVPKAQPAFEDPAMLRRVWGREWGARNDVGTIKAILLHRPGREMSVMTPDRYDSELDALIDDANQWYFRSEKGPDLAAMQAEHDGLVRVLSENGVEILYCGCSPIDPDAMFVRDCGMVVPGGVIISRMGTVGRDIGTGRRGEEQYVMKALVDAGMPVLRTIHGEGLMEGGSFTLLDEKHAAVGLSYRCNKIGAQQVREVLQYQGIELIEIPLTGYAMHLDGAINMVDHQKAIINVERLPYWFLDKLSELGIQVIMKDHRDPDLGLNCLTLRPGTVIMDADAPYTAELLEKSGVSVIPIPWKECKKHGGGIHCATLPLIRADD